MLGKIVHVSLLVYRYTPTEYSLGFHLKVLVTNNTSINERGTQRGDMYK